MIAYHEAGHTIVEMVLSDARVVQQSNHRFLAEEPGGYAMQSFP